MEYRIKKVSFTNLYGGPETLYKVQYRYTNLLKIFGWHTVKYLYSGEYHLEYLAIDRLALLRSGKLKVKNSIILNT